jgi:hypothetical protein
MKKNIQTCLSCIGAFAVALSFSGCKTPEAKVPVASGFLTTYRDMEQVDEVTWMRTSPDRRIRRYNSFIIAPVRILVKEFEGEPVRPEGVQEASNYMREALEKALSDRYPVVDDPGADVAELRVAITDAYREKGRVGMALEAEVLDSYSGYPFAAVVTASVDELWYGKKWASVPAKQIMDRWAAGFRNAIDEAKAGE